MNLKLKEKIMECLKMFEIIYSNRKELGVGLIRLWSLKKMKDRLREYLPLVDINDDKFITKGMIRDVEYIYNVYSTIINNGKGN